MTGEVIAGRYELEELVGTGGMSSVYRADDRMLDRKVALKLLHPHYTRDEDYVERFRREARAVAQLTHPNIVTVIDRGEQDGRQFIVFEYVSGETLKQLIQRRGPLPVREALTLTLQIARALAYAHGRGLVHRDVKPQNVLLNGEGQAKVTDFGIARSLASEGLTQPGTVLGTSDYIAPEQARGEEVDAQTDVYSLGVVLYELLAGRPPFSAESFLAVAVRHMNEPPPPLGRSDVPAHVEAVLERALAKARGDRYGTMAELVVALELALAELDTVSSGERTHFVPRPDEEPTRITPAQPLPPRQREPRRRRWPRVAVALGVLVLAAAGAFAWQSTRDGEAGVGDGDDGPIAQTVELAGVDSYDPPPGDGVEHDDSVALATDGNLATYWTTERYRPGGFSQKDGVGLVLRAATPVALERLQLRTDTPGRFEVEIQAGSSPQGDFVSVSESRSASATTTLSIDTGGEEYDYYVVWVRLSDDGSAHVNEVTAG